jgi:hypothetical protein
VLRESVRALHFGWNARTTQEARVVKRGRLWEIRINFTVEDDTSAILSRERRWTAPVRKCGGVLDLPAGKVRWPAGAAERYCAFVLLHELAHILYWDSVDVRSRSLGGLEATCDRWASEQLRLARATVGEDQ